MACPMGFTGPNPHGTHPPVVVRRSRQTDGRLAPVMPPKPREPTPWHQTEVKQGPVPAWASFIASWYNQLWAGSRATIFALFILALAPALHVLALLAITLPLRWPSLRRPARVTFFPAYRCVQSLYTGVLVCLFESLANVWFMFSGKVANEFWQQEAVKQLTAKPRVTIFLSNQTTYTSFLDVVVFFSLAYRRKQLSNLYFLPFEKSEWDIASGLLHLVCLSPLTVNSTSMIDLLLSYGASCSFVWFPEATSAEDAATSAAPRRSMSTDDLLHVIPPRLSSLFVHLVAVTAASGVAELDIVECTIAYSGSVLHDVAQQQAEAIARSSPNGALDEDEEDEFNKPDANDESEDGYSAETINNYAQGTIATRRKRRFEPSIPVFCTAAPLRPIAVMPATEESDGAGDNSAVDVASPSSGGSTTSSSNQSAHTAALLRPRVVPSFYSFLSGNAPTHVHLLLNQFDHEMIRTQVLNVDAKKGSPTSVDAESSSLARSLEAWLQQRFLHQEQQLSLFAVHSSYHQLPASLSASSTPLSHKIESYAVPVSSIRLALYVALDWIVIFVGTLMFKHGRTYWAQP